MTPRPPRLAEWVLRLTTGRAYRDAELGDLREEFADRCAAAGRPHARQWYWRQVRRSLGPNLRRQLIGVAQARAGEDSRGRARLSPFHAIGQDTRYAIRSLGATPGLTATALLVLTLGIGATTAVFSIVDAVVLRPLPYPDPDHLVAVRESVSPQNPAFTSVYPQDFIDWSAEQHVFQGLAAMGTSGAGFIDQGGPQPTALHVSGVSPNFFAVLGVSPELGRTFATDREVAEHPNLAVISDTYWRQRFGADPHVIGRILTLDNGPWEIVGVMPGDFITPFGGTFRQILGVPTDMWVPLVIPASARVRGSDRTNSLDLIGRLNPGVTLERAQAEMTQISDSLIRTYPTWYRGSGRAHVYQLSAWLIGPNVRAWMLMLFGAVICVLVIACVNVANLLLARATTRSREMGIRAALGAGRWRLVRGALVEGLLLSLIGTGLALIAAVWIVDALRTALPPGVPRAAFIGVNARVLWTAFGAALVTGVGFGIVPALSYSGASVVTTLREDARSGTASPGRQRLRGALVVGEVALAVALVVGAALFVTSFARLMAIDVGIDYHHVLTASFAPTVGGATPAQQASAAQTQLKAVVGEVEALPGALSVGLFAGPLPFSGGYSFQDAYVPGRTDDFHGDTGISVYAVTPAYLKSVRLPLLGGRSLTEADDRSSSEPVVLLNHAATRLYFGATSPIGMPIGVPDLRTIVGIVGDMRPMGPETPARPEAYIPLAQSTATTGTLVIRVAGDPADLARPVKRLIAATMPHRVVADPLPLETLFGRLIAQRRFNMLLVGLFGVLGMAIAVAGVYGVMAYWVAQRTREIGVRIALGAGASRVLTMVLGQAAGLLGLGVALGVLLSWTVAGFLRTFLFQVSAHDWAVYAAVPALLLVTGLAAAYVPARRAAHVDPLTALRAE